jgi:hypothetical protein
MTQKMGQKRKSVKNELILLCVIHDKIKYCTLPNLENNHQNKKLKNDARPYSLNKNCARNPWSQMAARFPSTQL